MRVYLRVARKAITQCFQKQRVKEVEENLKVGEKSGFLCENGRNDSSIECIIRVVFQRPAECISCFCIFGFWFLVFYAWHCVAISV